MNVRSLSTFAAAAGLCAAGTASAQMPGAIPTPIAPATTASANQQLAEAVVQRLATSGAAQAADVSISVVEGVVTLQGVCKDSACHDAVVQQVRLVPGVKRVRDGLSVGVQQAQAIALPTSMPTMGPVAAPLAFGQPPMGGGAPVVEPTPLGGGGMMASEGSAPPLPPYAWPTYAPHNNVSRVGYPTAYPYNAFPFIGPFYPFPKVPLGWRKVLLEWEDGHWWIGKTQSPQDYWRVRFW